MLGSSSKRETTFTLAVSSSHFERDIEITQVARNSQQILNKKPFHASFGKLSSLHNKLSNVYTEQDFKKKIGLKESFLSTMLHNILEVICDFYPKACWGEKKNCSKISTMAKLFCRFILYMAMQFDAQDVPWKCLLRHAVFNFKVNMANT